MAEIHERFGVVILSEEGVGPTGGPPQGLVLDDGGVVEQVLFPALVLEPVIGPGPDAGQLVEHFAEAVPGAAAGAVPLVLRAGGLGAEVGDVRQGTVAAVLALEENRLAGVLEEAQEAGPWAGSLLRP